MTPVGREGRWFGVFQTADILGFGIGPLLAGVVREFVSFDAVFVCMAVLMGSSATMVLFMLPARVPRRPDAVTDIVEQMEMARAVPFRVALGDRLVAALTLFSAITSLSFGATLSFLGLRLEDDIGVSPTLIGVAFSIQDLSGALCQPFFGGLADRRNRRVMVAGGLVLSSVLLVGVGIADEYWLVVLALALLGGSQTIASSAGSAIQVVAGRRVGMGTMLGLFSFGNGVGILVGSGVGGLMKDLYGTQAAFYFGAAAIASGAAVFTLMTRGVRVNEEPVLVVPDVEVRSPAAS